jgi:hypothetical protein
VEASLDVQFLMGVAPGVLTEFWYVAGSDFCGDLKNWTQLLLDSDDVPLVNSVSYGWQGDLAEIGCDLSNAADVDADLAKLAAKGITLIFASGDSGSGWSPPRPLCRAHMGENDTTLVGTPLGIALPAADLVTCCSISGREPNAGFTFIAPPKGSAGERYCKGVAERGVALTGRLWGGGPEQVPSQQACCDFAQDLADNGRGIEGWTFKDSGGDGVGICRCFLTVNGTTPDTKSASMRGKVPPPTHGNCTIFSSVTGNTTEKGAIAYNQAQHPSEVTLWPAWPASSRWVTSVGATRFVGQQVDGEEMASDQFGSGGGFSGLFDSFGAQNADVQAYLGIAPQLPPAGSFPPGGRATPDVCALGEGFQVLTSGHTQPVGGTSASTPLFAGLVSLLNEARLAASKPPLGYLNNWICAFPLSLLALSFCCSFTPQLQLTVTSASSTPASS